MAAMAGGRGRKARVDAGRGDTMESGLLALRDRSIDSASQIRLRAEPHRLAAQRQARAREAVAPVRNSIDAARVKPKVRGDTIFGVTSERATAIFKFGTVDRDD